MLENRMKERIVDDLKKAKEAGQITTEKVSEIVKDAVSAAVDETRGDVEDLRPVVRDAVAAALEGLKDAGADAKENVGEAVKGAIAGARSRGDQEVAAAMQELEKLETRIENEKARLEQSIREALQGAKEAGIVLPGDIKDRVLSTVNDIKLKSAELLGLTKQTVKEAVKLAIESGENVKGTVGQISSDATERALKEGRFSADRVKGITEKIISAAVEAAEEAGKETKDVATGAFEGAQKGIASVVDTVGDKTKSFFRNDLARTKGDIEAIEAIFIATIRKVARRSGEEAKDALNGLADQSRKTSSVLREKARIAGESASERLKEVGKHAAKASTEAVGKATDVMAEEAKQLGKKSLALARGAISGMLKGAKEALKKEEE